MLSISRIRVITGNTAPHSRSNMTHRLLPSVLFLVLLGSMEGALSSHCALSQDFDRLPPVPQPAQPNAVDDQLQRLIEQRALLEAESDRLETEYRLLRQQQDLTRLRGPVLPETTDATRPLEPSRTDVIEGGKNSVETRILIYEAMDKVAGAIYEDIRPVTPIQSLIIYDQDIFASLAAYRLLKIKINEFQARYARLNIYPQPSRPRPRGTRSRGSQNLTAIGLPTQLTRTILEFVALFRSEDRITLENDFYPNPNALISAVAARFQAQSPQIKIFSPGFHLLRSTDIAANNIDTLIGPDLATLIRLRSQVSAFASPDLSALNQEVDTFTANVFSVPEETNGAGTPALRAILIAHQLEQLLARRDTYVLNLDIDVSGGSRRTRRSLFTSIISGSRLSFSGGVVVNYSLLDRDGALKKSNFFYYNTGYRSMKGKKTNIPKR